MNAVITIYVRHFKSISRVFIFYIFNHDLFQLIFYIFAGASATTLSNRTSYVGFKYHADQFCSETPYIANLTNMDEAVTMCSNDPHCFAVEDRWGSGKAPIGLCKRQLGLTSGAGSYLLKKGRSWFSFF